MIQFNESHYYKRLKEAALHPLDFTKTGLTAERVSKFKAEGCGIKLLYAPERVAEDVLKDLHSLAEDLEVIDMMKHMQSGKVLNYIKGAECENRPVLHTAMRDIFEDHKFRGKVVGEATDKALKECVKLQDFIQKLAIDNLFTDLVVVGIGGSELGSKALYTALSVYKKKDRQAHFIANVDPDNVLDVLGKLNLTKTLVVSISKSGTTLETKTNEEFIRAKFSNLGLNSTEHFISVTQEGSPMDNPSKYLASFHIWEYIGGRYSVTSMVGGVVLAFTLGYENYLAILKGAHDMDRLAVINDLNYNLPLLGALLNVWNRSFLNYSNVVIMPYSYALRHLISHIQQCEMESNGKRAQREGGVTGYDTGAILFGDTGTNAQHSFCQFLHQGEPIIPIEFIAFAHNQYQEDFSFEGTNSQQKLLASLIAQAIALAIGKKHVHPHKAFSGNRPSRILFAERLDPYTMGALLAYYEHKTVFQGFIWGINSFDQEGVQLGKQLSDDILAILKGSKRLEDFPIYQGFFKELNFKTPS